MKILLIDGPNAHPGDVDAPGELRCHAQAGALGVALEIRHSQDEGEIIGWIHQARGNFQAIIINAASLSRSSIAVMDALLTFDGDVIEVHASNIHRSNAFGDDAYVSKAARGTICGLGPLGHELAIRAIAQR